MPMPSLASRASARVFPSSSCSEISTGQLSTVVMAAHLLLPDAGAAVLRLAVPPPSSARPGSQVKSLMSPPGEFLLLGSAESLATSAQYARSESQCVVEALWQLGRVPAVL